jgi:putative ABC transport system permease protein
VLGGFLCGPVVSGVRIAATYFFPAQMATLPRNIQTLEPLIAPWSVIAAFGISVAVGVIFGLYPARRAAYMDPIEALRHE